ncbi:HD domain-containing protein [Actinoplanes sp. CA-030573]|uniref:caspase family protein n=1 Tax=Actinoplanes sp. CA-030573 TaxID=3239898 RepID=UPI003D9203B7
MSRPPRKALLIGVTDYDDTNIAPLPFIADDLDDLGKALKSVGYEVEQPPAHNGDRDRIDTAIEQFCRRAQPGQQLLIFLSGHGIHWDGSDYLVPSSADTASRKFVSRCLRIDFDGHIEDSRCGDVLVVIDACREGVVLGGKSGYSHMRGWGVQQSRRSAERTIAYLYACSSGELARWKKTADGTFSLFTRAFSRALIDISVPGALTEVRDAVRVRLENLSAELGVPLQKPHLDGELDRCARLMLVDRSVAAVTSRGAPGWAERARNHEVWDLVRPGPNEMPVLARALQDAVVECVEAWSRRYRELRAGLSDDPWWDDELAIRMHDRLSWIVKHVLNPGKLAEGDRPPLSPAEAAVLVLVPYAQQVHRAHCAVTSRAVLTSDDDAAAEFRRFVGGRRRIQRRLDRLEASGDSVHAAAVRWGAYHRWLAQRPQAYRPAVVAGCLLGDLEPPRNDAERLLRELISEESLARHLRALRSDPESSGPTGAANDDLDGAAIPAGARTVAGGTPNEQQVRDRLIALILLVAEEFTIDASALPVVITDHVGLTGGVEIGEVLRAVQTARWSARGRTRVLEAECPHQAVQLALDEHTRGIAEALRRIDAAAEEDRTLGALRDLPTHVAADGLRPLTGPDGKPRYEDVGFRFRLDDDRVQELLMGEQLYGDPALAIRELYQNALDACRYRRARTQHLRRTRPWLAEWEGRITFSQGVDSSGRAWLECTDNGIGMSERELSSVFSHAGARFADLPEFLEEQAAWDREEIEFYPNSRFGIGVLSYFMLGDEITVSTARFSREGTLRPRLQVNIDGPGSLCRIRNTDSTGESGTTVRIYLRPDVSVSCVDLLTRLLWVAEFPVTATDGSAEAGWAPDVLSSQAPIGTGDPLDGRAASSAAVMFADGKITVLRSTVRNVWWCDGPGGILADGLWVGEAPFGRIVNLSGPVAPRLSVDRRRVIAVDGDRVRRLLEAAVPDLIAGVDQLDILDWLGILAADDLRLADTIAQSVIDARVICAASGGSTVDTGLVGVFPLDAILFATKRSGARQSRRVGSVALGEWRLRSYLRARLVKALRLDADNSAAYLAKPSDGVLVSRNLDGKEPWLDPSEQVSAAHVLVAGVVLEWPLPRVVDRLREIGVRVPDHPWTTAALEGDDLRLLAEGREGRGPWLDLTSPVPAQHVVRAAALLGWSFAKVAGRLRDLGATVTGSWSSSPVTADDQRLLRIEPDEGRSIVGPDDLDRWLDPASRVDPSHVIGAAAALGWSPRRVVDRLRQLGAEVPELAWPDKPFLEDDRRLMSRNGNGKAPWLDLSAPIPSRLVLSTASSLRWSPRRTADRLQELGAQVAALSWAADPLSAEDRILLTHAGFGPGMWLDLSDPVPAGHVVVCAAALLWSPRQVIDRLEALGAHVADFVWPDITISAEDRQIVSSPDRRHRSWLDPFRPVPVEHVFWAAAMLAWSPRRVADRLHQLGLTVSDFAWPGVPLDDHDQRLFQAAVLTAEQQLYRRALDDRPGPGELFPATNVVAAAVATGWPPRRVVDRLRELGGHVVELTWSEEALTDADQRLLSSGRTFYASWLDLSQPISGSHVLAAAADLGWSPRRAAARLRELGAQVRELAWPDAPLSSDDQRLLRWEEDSSRPTFGLTKSDRWLDLFEPIPAEHVIAAAVALGWPPRRVVDRLREMGGQVAETTWLCTPLTSQDQRIFSHSPGTSDRWLRPGELVSAGRLLPGINGTYLSIAGVARRLEELGAVLPPDIEVVEEDSPTWERPSR